MRFPWDDQPDEGFYGPQLRLPPAPLPPVSEPDYVGEFNAPQEQMPDDFFSRLAQGGFNLPAPQIGNKPTGLEVLLALASGFVQGKTNQARGRISETEQRNQRAREAAKTLADRKWEMRRIAYQGAQALRNVQASRGRPKTQEQIRAESEARRSGEIAAEAGAGWTPPRTRNPNAPTPTPKPRAVKPGPVMPELTSLESQLSAESRARQQEGRVAEADSTRNLAGRIKDLHAAIRQAQTREELDELEIPEGTPERVLGKIAMARKNRLRQIGATR